MRVCVHVRVCACVAHVHVLVNAVWPLRETVWMQVPINSITNLHICVDECRLTTQSDSLDAGTYKHPGYPTHQRNQSEWPNGSVWSAAQISPCDQIHSSSPSLLRRQGRCWLSPGYWHQPHPWKPTLLLPSCVSCWGWTLRCCPGLPNQKEKMSWDSVAPLSNLTWEISVIIIYSLAKNNN